MDRTPDAYFDVLPNADRLPPIVLFHPSPEFYRYSRHRVARLSQSLHRKSTTCRSWMFLRHVL